MAYGRPPLASAIGGLGEVVVERETGRLLPPGDAGALAAAIAEIIDQPASLQGYAAAGRKRYESLFSEENAAAAIADAAREVLARSGRAEGGSRPRGRWIMNSVLKQYFPSIDEEL